MRNTGFRSNASSNSCDASVLKAPQELHNVDQIEFTLPCGLPCVVVTRPYGKSFGAALMLRVGSRDDPAGLPGLAHFSEHLAFRGENLAIVEKLSQDGAQMRAYTGPSYTQFQFAAHQEQLTEGLAFFANVVSSTDRTPETIRAEQPVFRHELSESLQSIRGRRNAAFQSFWRSVTGDPNWRIPAKKYVTCIRRLNRDVVEPFMRRYYVPANARLAIVAPLSAEQLRQSVEGTFADVESTQQGESSIPSVTSRRMWGNFDGSRYVWIKLVALTTRSDATMRFAAALAANRLGVGPHSALFRRLRSERSLAYNVSGDDWPDLDHTLVHCFASVHYHSLSIAIGIMLQEIRRLAGGGVNREQYEAFRRQRICQHEMRMEYPRELACFLAYEMLRPASERMHDSQAYLDHLEQLNIHDVNQAIAELLAPANRYLFIAGPVGPLARFQIRRWLMQ